MLRNYSLPFHKTVLKNAIFLGLFFIVGQVSAQVTTLSSKQTIVLAQNASTESAKLFHQGLQSYLDKDFQSAYQAWTLAVRGGHSKSAFNIAKMWENGQVPNQQADLNKAKQFYSISAEGGYLPAKEYLANQNEQTRSISQSTEQQKLVKLETELEKGHSSSFKRYWSIQIFASKDINQVKKMISDNNIQAQSAILPEQVDKVIWYKLVYGRFSTHKEAAEIRDKLPSALQVVKPWIRMISVTNISN